VDKIIRRVCVRLCFVQGVYAKSHGSALLRLKTIFIASQQLQRYGYRSFDKVLIDFFMSAAIGGLWDVKYRRDIYAINMW
jgi:hypothetical protein